MTNETRVDVRLWQQCGTNVTRIKRKGNIKLLFLPKTKIMYAAQLNNV